MEPAFRKGIEEFNQALYFQCHETLEAYWHKQAEPQRQLTQGIIQIAVAYHHLGNSNKSGALKLFSKGLVRLIKFSSENCGIDIASLIRSVEQKINQLSGPQEQESLSVSPKIRFK